MSFQGTGAVHKRGVNFNENPNKLNNLKKRTIDEQTIGQLQQAFNLFDSQQTGQIDARELKAIMRAFGIYAQKQDIKNIFRETGQDINETINFHQFVSIMTVRLGERDSIEEIQQIFQLFDEDRQGKISYQNLMKISSDVGENLSPQEIEEMLQQADRDGDGFISFEEFYRVMQRRDNPLDDIDSDDD